MAEDRMLSDEILFALIKKNSGGGGGGTNNYNQLENKPQIGGVTLQGNKTASDLGLASEEDLEEKQDVLTAGNYVSISNDGTINVTKAIGVYDRVRYVFTPESDGYYMRVEVYINDVKRFEQQYQNTEVFNHVVIMELVEFWYGGDGYYWHYKPLIDSREHAKDIVISWYYTEMDVHEETFDVPQDDSTTLATKGDVNTAINAIKDGTNIDSFADVESALANKQDKTDNSLQTTDKTVVGGINELKSGLTNYELQNNINLEVPNRKNLLPITLSGIKALNTSGTWNGNDYTYNGVTFSIVANANDYVESITANGTASDSIYLKILGYLSLSKGKYILSGAPSATCRLSIYAQGIWKGSDSGSSLSFEVTDDYTPVSNDRLEIVINSGYEATNVEFLPMVRLATITDPTFAPYIPSVDARLDAVESGLMNVQDDVKLNTNDLTTPSRTKNLLPMIVEEIKALNTSGTWSGNAYTLNGVTYTVNSDSTGAVTDIATSGTSSARSDFVLYSTNTDFNKYNGCILTGCPVGGSSLDYRMVFSSSDASQLFYDVGSGTSLTGITKTSGICAITTYGTGLDMSGKIFKPMIRLASVSDPTFAPYIPSVESRIEAVERKLTVAYYDTDDITTGADGAFNILSTNLGQIISVRSFGSHAIVPASMAGNNNYFISYNASTMAPEASTNIGKVRVYYAV